MTNPITPPPELRSKWFNEAPKTDLYDYIIEQAAQWGADQELEACCEWLMADPVGVVHEAVPLLRAARRPKPPSLKEQALEAMRRNYNPDNSDDFATIRRAWRPSMTDLSPAAQAVLDAYFTHADLLNREVSHEEMIAAALRSAADQVVPEQSEPPCGEGEPWPQSYQLMADSKWEQRQKTRDELLAIAAELKAQ